MERLKWAISNYRLNSVGIQEVCVNWNGYKSPNSLKGSDPIWVQKSFNTIETENIGYSQRGRTATVLNGALSKYIKDANVNHTGLGRWSWVKLEGQPGHVTRIVTAYGPCRSKSSGTKTYYQQQRRYIQNNSLRTTVKKMFRDDLCATLREWRNQGDRIILMMDANDTVSDKQLSNRR